MTRNFIGSTTHKLDGKGRVSLPADFRDVLRGEQPDKSTAIPDVFVLVPAVGGQEMHTAFTVAGHDALIARLKDLKYDNPIQREATRRRYIGLARRISVEEGGRFVLAKDLREMLGLEGAVQFVGDGGTFQLWHPDRYAASIALEDALDLDFGSMVG